MWLPRYSAVNPPIMKFKVLRLLGVPSLVLFVCVGLAVVESPSTRIRSPFELGAELVATLPSGLHHWGLAYSTNRVRADRVQRTIAALSRSILFTRRDDGREVAWRFPPPGCEA